jgi:DNA repair protein RecO (recombination protein O)
MQHLLILRKEYLMVEKTTAIVLHQLKYTDSGIIVHVYSEKFGRLSVMVKGLRNKKTGKHNIHFQPLTVLDLVIYYKETTNVHLLKEFSVSYSPDNIHGNLKKSCIAIFMGEVLTTVLKEESPHKELFEYLHDSIVYFNESQERYMNFHIAFLSGLSSYLGFEPGRSYEENQVFDMVNGTFMQVPPAHGNYTDQEISGILASFFSASWYDMESIPLSGSKRNEVLETLLRYYSLHLPGLKKINSLEVLKEVFA